MKKDKILVKNMTSPEVMGTVNEIMCGKTSTLTKGDMYVSEFYISKRSIRNTKKNSFMNSNIEESVLKIAQDCIMFNATARIEMNEHALYIPVGNPTEVGMLRFLQLNDVAVHDEVKRKHHKELTHIPFSSARKLETFAIVHPDSEDRVRVYVKGAPLYVIEKCTSYHDTDGSITSMDEEESRYMKEDIFQMYCNKGLRTFAYAYKDMERSEFEEIKEEYQGSFKSEGARASLESSLTFCVLFGLEDKLRSSVKKSFEFAKKGGITVRIVSGDSLETAKRTAINAGLISEAECNFEGVCMTGEDFRSKVGGIIQSEERNEEGNIIYEVENIDEFRKIEARLRVLAMTIPEDKLSLVCGLKQLGRSVAVTGDSNNDSKALFNGHVGLAMGSGCEVAKDSSDMILINDNFASVLFANMWGRNIYANIKKFLQF